MAKLKVYGNNGVRTIEVQEVDPPQDDGGLDKARKRAFAIMNDLEPKLRDVRCPVGRLWEHFKNLYGVDSRAKFTIEEWSLVGAQLQAAKDSYGMLQVLVRRALENTETPVPAAPTPPPPTTPAARRAIYEACPF